MSFLLCCSAAFADEEIDTTVASGGNQIIVSPLDMILDVGEIEHVRVFVLDKDGNPIKAKKIQILPLDKTKIAVESDSFLTNESGYIHFSIMGKQLGDTAVNITDGVISSQIYVAVKDLIHYALPYFYGNMQINLINPTHYLNYVKILFNENSDRLIPPVTIGLDGKEMKTITLSEELDETLKDGWVEVMSTDVILGGVWTSKGYLDLRKIEE